MKSYLYEGQVRHRRFTPRRHEFSYRLFYLYLDLDELDEVFANRLLWSVDSPNLAWFRRSDHLGDPSVPLKQAVCEYVADRTGYTPKGPVRLLTHPRYFGYGFNPVSFYYCFDEKDEKVETIVAEVSNTPWGEQHCYVLTNDGDVGSVGHRQYLPTKSFHVSPFMPMDIDYDWRFSPVDKHLNVHMENRLSGAKIFDATLRLDRRAITTGSLAGVLIRFPFLTIKVIFSIYYQALRLWLKKTPFYPHPDEKEAPHPASRV